MEKATLGHLRLEGLPGVGVHGDLAIQGDGTINTDPETPAGASMPWRRDHVPMRIGLLAELVRTLLAVEEGGNDAHDLNPFWKGTSVGPDPGGPQALTLGRASERLSTRTSYDDVVTMAAFVVDCSFISTVS